MFSPHSPKTRSLTLLLVALACACGDPADASPSLDWRSDDFSGVDPEPWNDFHPQYAQTSIVDGQFIIRPNALTAWHGNNEAFQRYVMLTGDFMMTAHVEVGDLAGGPALPEWRLGGLLVRNTEQGPVEAYDVTFGALNEAMSPDLVAEYKSTEAGNSTFGFVSNPSGAGDLRLCRVGTNIRALFRPDETSEWVTLDARERPELSETVAAGPMAWAYSPTVDFEAAFDYVNIETPTSVDDCTADSLGEEGDSGSGSDSDSGSDSGSGSGSGESTGDAEGTGSAESTGGDGSTGGDESTGGEPEEPLDQVPLPTAACPPINDGDVGFCPAGLGGTCRNVRISNAAGATATGPLQIHWHGTGETPEGLLASDSVTQQILTTTIAEGGIMVMPDADPDALARPVAFPWWIVGDITDPAMHVDREDDFILMDEVVACIIEAGLASPDRINTSGFSAGGIMTSHIVEQRGYFASAVSWSGGTPTTYQPAEPIGATSVMAIHGGPTDLYCDEGVVGGGCFDFAATSEALATVVVDEGNFGFICDHHGGHAPNIGLEGSEFMRLANRGADHPWADYVFGSGANWVLDNYCHAPGSPSPWD